MDFLDIEKKVSFKLGRKIVLSEETRKVILDYQKKFGSSEKEIINMIVKSQGQKNG